MLMNMNRLRTNTSSRPEALLRTGLFLRQTDAGFTSCYGGGLVEGPPGSEDLLGSNENYSPRDSPYCPTRCST